MVGAVDLGWSGDVWAVDSWCFCLMITLVIGGSRALLFVTFCICEGYKVDDAEGET